MYMLKLFAPITKIFTIIFEAIHNIVVSLGVTGGASYVLAITILTVIIRACLLPFNIKSARSSKKMQEIQPEVKKIQEKYKNDPQKAQMEMMNLYKEKNVSMTGGCLPALLPLPILMALYGVFYSASMKAQIEGLSFLWIKNLAEPDKLFILPILAAITTYIPSYLMTKATPANSGTPNMSGMNIGMSLMMAFMSINFQSILVIFWVVGGLIQIANTYFINYRPAKKEALELKEKEEAKKALDGSKFFMQNYEETNKASKKKKKKKKN